MLLIHQIKCPIGTEFSKEMIARKLKCSDSDILSCEIERQSLDARSGHFEWSYSVYAQLRNERKYLRNKDVEEKERPVYEVPQGVKTEDRPVIAGFGPAGMFAALILAEAGMRPVVIERGKPCEERIKDVEKFFAEGILDEESNVQYGEGGAGTFSDGKLTSRSKNYRVRKVLEELVEAGADPAILYEHMPHLGTDRLRSIVTNIRKKIISLGGEVHFSVKLESLDLKDRTLNGVLTSNGRIDTQAVLLCLGHSPFSTYQSLYEQGVHVIPKDFALGVRVEHPQILIDRNQYGEYAGHPALGHASYKLTHRSSAGRGVYSFCMCPGGIVVPSSSDHETLAVNGMSYSARDGKNANSAILVQIPVSDYDHGHPLDGFAFQHAIEKKAYRGGYQAPAMNIRDFVNHDQSAAAVLESSCPRGILMEDMHGLFSDAVNVSLEDSFIAFDRKIPGFLDGLMVGTETRSSSVIRMVRDENGQSVNTAGVFPCGEGAGYAGGIVSSAADGIVQAENVIRFYREKQIAG